MNAVYFQNAFTPIEPFHCVNFNEVEACFDCEELIDFRVADVYVGIGIEARLHIIEVLFEDGEVHRHVVFTPDPLLVADGAVGAAPDDTSASLDGSHEIDSDAAARFAEFERAVYIEANQLQQCIFRFGSRMYWFSVGLVVAVGIDLLGAVDGANSAAN